MDCPAATREETALCTYTCPECGESFAISDAAFSTPSRLLLCPCCGSTELIVETAVMSEDAA
jgi:hypothetical protein